MRADMILGLRGWRDAPSGRGAVRERVDHAGWSVELTTAALGVVGFVFEGRPNVLADAAGVIRGGNSVVFRIGSDALETARAMMRLALRPALAEAGLPDGTAELLESPAHAAGWALFADARLSLAVARGSGPAVSQLGQVARQAGTPVSLHGTGGAWMLLHESAAPERVTALVAASLDRKVCNTLNVALVPRAEAGALLPAVLKGLEAAAAARGVTGVLHAGPKARPLLPPAWRETSQPLAREAMGVEWEWDDRPELSLEVVEDLDEAIGLFNRLSPRFVASVIAGDPAILDPAFAALDAAFVGDGFTRWVDGQYALNRPELGLANWQAGRLFARGGVLSGDGVYTVKTRMRQGPGVLRR
jgi:glutamate-5-semialdehyde dehydrogenase